MNLVKHFLLLEYTTVHRQTRHRWMEFGISGAMEGDVHAYQHLISEPTRSTVVKRLPTLPPPEWRVAKRIFLLVLFILLLRQQLAQAIPEDQYWTSKWTSIQKKWP